MASDLMENPKKAVLSKMEKTTTGASDLIIRDALLDEYDRVHVGKAGGARKLIAEAPAVDAVEVVRCKDCEFGQKPTVCARLGTVVKPNDFCSYGMRRKKKDTVD